MSARQPAAVTPMAYARVIAAAMTRGGRNPADALHAAQLTPSRLAQIDARITSLQMEALSGAAMQALDDEGLGAFSRRLPWGSYGMLARASLSSPNLGVALKRWCRHHALITDDIRLTHTPSSNEASITLRELRRIAPEHREFCMVHVLRNIHGVGCWFIDSRIALTVAAFPFAAPPHADAYR